jgi:hypothetical protein
MSSAAKQVKTDNAAKGLTRKTRQRYMVLVPHL